MFYYKWSLVTVADLYIDLSYEKAWETGHYRTVHMYDMDRPLFRLKTSHFFSFKTVGESPPRNDHFTVIFLKDMLSHDCYIVCILKILILVNLLKHILLIKDSRLGLFPVTINVSTDRLKWCPIPTKTQEFTLRHNIQRHLCLSESWIFCVSLVRRTCNVWHNELCRYFVGHLSIC